MEQEKGFSKSYVNAKTFSNQIAKVDYQIDDTIRIINVDGIGVDKNKIGKTAKLIEIDNIKPNDDPLIFKARFDNGFSYWFSEKNIEKA